MAEKRAGLFDDLRDTLTPEQRPECLWLVLKMTPQYRKSPRTQILDSTAILRVKEDVCWRILSVQHTWEICKEGLPNPVDQDLKGLMRTAWYIVALML